MNHSAHLDETEVSIGLYLIRTDRPVSSEEITRSLRLPSEFWAEYYLNRMKNKGLLTESNESYGIKPESESLVNRLYISRYFQRSYNNYTFYLSLVFSFLILSLTYSFFLPKSVFTTTLFSSVVSVASGLIVLVETIRTRRGLKMYNDMRR
jgi:hypothetical protein